MTIIHRGVGWGGGKGSWCNTMLHGKGKVSRVVGAYPNPVCANHYQLPWLKLNSIINEFSLNHYDFTKHEFSVLMKK
jgi:hypothetical protein